MNLSPLAEIALTDLSLHYGINLSEEDEQKVRKCAIAYHRNFFRDFFSRIWNAVCHLFGESDWQQARRCLIPNLRDVVLLHTPVTGLGERIVDEKKVKVLADSILRNVTTLHSQGQGHAQILIDPNVWARREDTAPECRKVLERVIYGNGREGIPPNTLRTLLDTRVHTSLQKMFESIVKLKVLINNGFTHEKESQERWEEILFQLKALFPNAVDMIIMRGTLIYSEHGVDLLERAVEEDQFNSSLTWRDKAQLVLDELFNQLGKISQNTNPEREHPTESPYLISELSRMFVDLSFVQSRLLNPIVENGFSLSFRCNPSIEEIKKRVREAEEAEIA